MQYIPPLKILQWNSRSIKSNKASFEQFVLDYKPDICLISETWLTTKDNFRLKNYNITRQDRLDKIGGGVGIFVHKRYSFQILKFQLIPNELDICGIVLNLNNTVISFISVYNPPKFSCDINMWNNILKQTQGLIFLGGDFNAHHQSFGDSYSNSMGNKLVEMTNDNHLVLLNDGSATCYKFNPPSVTDLTFTSDKLALHCSWQVTNDLLGSDHLVVLTEIGNLLTPNGRYIIRPKVKWNLSQVNWVEYAQDIDNLILEEDQNHDLSCDPKIRYDSFIQKINHSAENNIPERKEVRLNRQYPEWWNENCFLLKSFRKESFLQYKNNMCHENFIQLRQTERFVKIELRKIKKQSWIRFCESINRNSTPQQIWKKVKIMKNVQNPSSKRNADNNDWTETFLENLTPMHVDRPVSIANCLEEFPKNNKQSSFLNTSFTFRELEIALKRSLNSSPGKDQILYPMLSNLSKFSKSHLLSILNEIWRGDVQIPDFKTIIIQPILKPNNDPNHPSSYRPISLMSCVYKTLERIIKFRLEHWLESKNVMPPTQFGFRKSKSAIDAVNYLVTDIELELSSDKYLIASFIDIKSAYDNVDLNILHQKLLQLGIPYYFASRTINLFKNRSLFIRVNGKLLGPRIANSGLPQGSVLSPLLFNIYCLDLYDYLGSRTKIIQFADDFCFYTYAKTFEWAQFFLSSSMENFHFWCFKNGFTVSENKSSVVVFCRHRHQHLNHINLGPFDFPVNKTVKYLGIHINSRLNWSKQIDYTVAKCQKSTNILKALTTTWWGGHPDTLLNIYKAIVRSHLDYGCLLWSNISKKQSDKLNRAQHQALRICLGSMKSTPIPCILAEAAEPPLKLRRQFLARKYILRTFQNKSENLISKFSETAIQSLMNEKYWIHKKTPLIAEAFCELSINREFCDSASLYEYPLPILLVSPFVLPILQYSDIASYNEKLILETLFENKIANVIYTDGSKCDNGSGAAFLSPSDNFSGLIQLHPSCSVFTTELVAIIEALTHIKNNRIQNCAICTDSRSATSMLTNLNFYHNIKNMHIFKILSLIYDISIELNYSVAFLWVKAHVGIKHNEEVDQLAKIAVSSPTIRCYNNYKVPFSDVFPSTKIWLLNKWRKDFAVETKRVGRNYASMHGTLKSKPWFHQVERPRKTITTISRLKFGHCSLPFHLFKLNIMPSPLCPCDNQQVANVNHILFNCSNNTPNINIFLSKLVKLGFQLPTNFTLLIYHVTIEVIDIIIQFLNKSNLQP